MPRRNIFMPVAFLVLSLLSCRIADVLATQPTLEPAPQPPVASHPTVAPQPTIAILPTTARPPTQVSVVPTQPPATQPSAALPPGCTNPNATITSLTDNGTVSGLIEIKGTAARADMQYWKLEFRPSSNTAYDILNRSEKAITDDVLARLSTKTLPNGVYYIRLVVVQKDGNFATPCEFKVNFQN